MKAIDILKNYDEHILRLGIASDALLRKHLKGVVEYPDASAKVIGYGYGPGYKDTLCALILSKKMIKIGFYKGSELDDPAGLLKGSGKVHRYVEIIAETDLKQPALKALLAAALKAYRERSVTKK